VEGKKKKKREFGERERGVMTERKEGHNKKANENLDLAFKNNNNPNNMYDEQGKEKKKKKKKKGISPAPVHIPLFSPAPHCTP
jgi:hypothetical protein